MISSVFGVDVSPAWMTRFYNNHKDLLSSRTTTPLGEDRSDATCLDRVRVFVGTVEKFLEQYPVGAHQVVNYDESRITVRCDGKLKLKRLVSRGKNKAQHRPSASSSHCGTIIPFVSANGKCLKVYFVMSHKFKEKAEDVIDFSLPPLLYRTQSGGVPYEILWNDSGYLNNADWKTISNDFAKVWASLYPGLVCFCVSDNLAAHHQQVVLEEGLQNNIFYFFLVQHTTHWSQPLDNLLFAALKAVLYRLIADIMYERVFVLKTVISLIDVTLAAVHEAFSPKTIKKSFEVVGLWPFSPQKILELAEKHHGHAAPMYAPTTQDQYLIQAVTGGVGFMFEETKAKGLARDAKRRKVRQSFQKGVLYDPCDIIHQQQQHQKEKEREEKEKAEKAKEKEVAKVKRAEEIAQKRQEKEALMKERKQHKEDEANRKRKRQEANTCKGNCGKTCRVGRNWVGCEKCEEFWVCPFCSKKPAVKGKLTKHENRCHSK